MGFGIRMRSILHSDPSRDPVICISIPALTKEKWDSLDKYALGVKLLISRHNFHGKFDAGETLLFKLAGIP